MRYKPEQKQATRALLLSKAAPLVKRQGFAKYYHPSGTGTPATAKWYEPVRPPRTLQLVNNSSPRHNTKAAAVT